MTDAHAHAAGHDDHAEHPHVNYFMIFIALCVCTVLSILVDAAKSVLTYQMLLAMVLIVATAKATFVLLYFMHIRFEGAWKYVLLTPTIVLALALPFTLAPDIAFHYYSVQTTQRNEAAEWELAHRQSHATPHGAGAHGAAEHGKTEAHPAGEKHADHDHPAEAKPAPKKH